MSYQDIEVSSIYYYEKLCLSLICFCCAKFSMADDMYYLLYYLVEGIKITISYMKKPRGGSCNSGKTPLSLGAY